MTITSTSNKITYTGSGTTGPFTYNFKIFEDTDLEVTKYTIADGTSETLALTTDYTVTGAGEEAGGTLTLVATLSSSYKLIIRRVLPITQEIDYIANDPFPAASHEEALDRSTMINQQQQEQLDRAVLVPVGTTTDPEDLLAQIEANAATAAAAAVTAQAAVGSTIYLWGGIVGGTADAITLTPSPAITLYSNGMRFAFLATGTNTGATTVNVSGLGAKSVKTLLGAALAAGDITSGNVYSMTYDGTDFRIHESPKVLPVTSGGTGNSTVTQGDILYASAANTLSKLSAGTSGQYLKTQGAGANPAWSDLDGTWTDYSATSTIVGWSSYTTKLIYYKTVGNIVFVSFNLQGTSNSGTTSFTVANAAAAGVAFGGVCWQAVDAGIALATGAGFTLAAAGSTVDFRSTLAGSGGWTNSGSKTVSGTFFYIK